MSDAPAANETKEHIREKSICPVCPHACELTEGAVGICGVRTVQDGHIASLNYGMTTALALDPIEKKPLYRFHPGSYILSYGSYGCNLRCPFCQNSDISVVRPEAPLITPYTSPELLVERALELQPRNIGIAFTYNEPLVAPEYMLDASKLAQAAGLKTVAVTNGFATKKTLAMVLPHLDALNIDLKCFTEEGYRSLGAPYGLETVMNSILQSYEAGAHVEVTTLIVPGLSDDQERFIEECIWLASVDPSIPLHLSRFFPRHKAMDKEPTDISLLHHFASLAQEHLEYVYLGNI